MEEALPLMTDINQEDRKTVRASKSRTSGYTGLSILHRLQTLWIQHLQRSCLRYDAQPPN